ncbi:hypothetical protein FRC18_000640 [Serendipita sp. 400]|nr:hypothetical protein FRC18_000640 [Serendipita sp. 400]
MNFHRDGAMRHKISKGPNYWPNRFETVPPVGETFKSQGHVTEYPQRMHGVKRRVRTAKFQEHFSQAQLFYNSLCPHEKQHVIDALSFELNKFEEMDIVEKMIERLTNIDLDMAQKIAMNVGGTMPSAAGKANHGKKSAFLSQEAFKPSEPTIKSRKIAILVGDGFDAVGYEAMKGAILAHSAVPVTIGTRRSRVKNSLGKDVQPDLHFEGDRSTGYDALLIPGGAHVQSLAKSGRVIHWIREAFGHCKTIGAFGEGVDLVKAALPLTGLKFAEDGSSDAVVRSYAVVTARSYSTESAKADLSIQDGDTGFMSNFSFYLSQHRCWARETDGLVSQVAF